MDEWVWSNGGMILTGENWSTGRETLYSVGGRWMDECGAMVEWYWLGKTEVLGENHYTVWVVDGWMSMEQWWNGTDWGKLKYREKTLSQGHFFRHKSHTYRSGIEPAPSRWEADHSATERHWDVLNNSSGISSYRAVNTPSHLYTIISKRWSVITTQ